MQVPLDSPVGIRPLHFDLVCAKASMVNASLLSPTAFLGTAGLHESCPRSCPIVLSARIVPPTEIHLFRRVECRHHALQLVNVVASLD